MLQYDAYFDESGTNPGSRVVTVVGVLATPKRWRTFSREWWRILREREVKGEYKADACVRGYDEYETWGGRRRLELRATLGGLIDEHCVYAATASVLRADFEAALVLYGKKGDLWRDPYPWCLRSCLEFIAATPARGRRRVACIVDEGHGTQSRFFEYFWKVREPKGWENIFPSLTSAPSHKYAPLQAAEWLVYETRQQTDAWAFGTQKKHPEMLGVFRKLQIEGGYYARTNIDQFMNGVMSEILKGERETMDTWHTLVREEVAL